MIVLRTFSIVLSVCLTADAVVALFADLPMQRFARLAIPVVLLMNTGILLWERRRSEREG